jgi:Tannase and feruloyl esterase/PKD domain
MTAPETIDCASYQVTDSYFGAPYIDVDEWRDTPLRYRHVHGGFADCDTRFTMYFPEQEVWQGRAIMPLEGAHAGHEDAFGGSMGDLLGGLALHVRLGGYMVESNMGHIGDDVDPKGGDDPTIYGWRAAAETARFSKHVAAQIYGEAPHHSYVWGGSGGGRRSPLCLENAPDAFDGALPFMGGGNVVPFPATEKVKSGQPIAFACMFNIQRMLRHGDKPARLIDAMQPGGTGNPFEGLNSHEREELVYLYEQGFPFGDEHMIFSPMGQIWLWTSIADLLVEQDPTYFTNFWTEPGYIGHDLPSAVEDDVLDVVTTVSKVITVNDLMTDPAYDAPEFMMARVMATIMGGDTPDKVFAIEIAGLPDGYRLGAGVQLLSGEAAGRQLYTMVNLGDVFLCDGQGDANLKRFDGVKVGDEVHVDNRKFLAFCYFHRHHVMDDPQFDGLKLHGVPIYPQHPVPFMSPLMGVPYTGHYEGKLLWVHHTHDSSLWPSQGVVYEAAVRQAQGAAAEAEKFRLQWTEHAEHIMPSMLPSSPTRSTASWLIDYTPIIEQGLVDLIQWVEEGTPPPNTTYEYSHGQVSLPDTAAARGGIQPVVALTVNGGVRADVKVGEAVDLEAVAEVPPGSGTIVAVEWDFDGQAGFPDHEDVDGTDSAGKWVRTHTYDAPGTYFATARVCSNREGDVNGEFRRLPNLSSVRIVVT